LLADLAYMAFIERIAILGFAEAWEKRPGAARWAAALKARPSFRAASAPAEHRMPPPAQGGA
jgi:glutathione S-transferase